jgi:ABC-type lipoprotein release transport system permease subunit
MPVIVGQTTWKFLPSLRQRKFIVIIVLVLIALYVGLEIVGRHVINAARNQTERLYTGLLTHGTNSAVGELNEYVAKDLKRIESDLGPLVSFEVYYCTAQVTTVPALCKVKTQRQRGKSIETAYWYGDKCLMVKEEAPN